MPGTRGRSWTRGAKRGGWRGFGNQPRVGAQAGDALFHGLVGGKQLIGVSHDAFIIFFGLNSHSFNSTGMFGSCRLGPALLPDEGCAKMHLKFFLPDGPASNWEVTGWNGVAVRFDWI